MNEKFRAASLSLRLITAAVLAAVLIAAWTMGGWYVAALVAVLAVAGMGEFLFMFQREGGWVMKILGIVLAAGYVSAHALAPSFAPALAPQF